MRPNHISNFKVVILVFRFADTYCCIFCFQRELKALGDGTLILSGQQSTFHPCNIHAALRVVAKKGYCTAKELEMLKEKKEKKNLKKGMYNQELEIFICFKLALNSI